MPPSTARTARLRNAACAASAMIERPRRSCRKPTTASHHLLAQVITEHQESISLRGLRLESTWENGAWHSGSRWFADTEGVTGSNPVAPTNKGLTSGNAVALTVTALSAETLVSSLSGAG